MQMGAVQALKEIICGHIKPNYSHVFFTFLLLLAVVSMHLSVTLMSHHYKTSLLIGFVDGRCHRT